MNLDDLQIEEQKQTVFKIHESPIFALVNSDMHCGFFTGDKNGEIKFTKLGLNFEVKDNFMANSPCHEGTRGLTLSPTEVKLSSCHEDK